MSGEDIRYVICTKAFLDTPIPDSVKWNQDEEGNPLGRTVRTFAVLVWEHPTEDKACFICCAHPPEGPRRLGMVEEDHLDWEMWVIAYGHASISRADWLLEYKENGWEA
jgi:hypothetical protein